LGTAYFTRLTAAEDLPEIVTAMFDRLLPTAKSSRAAAELEDQVADETMRAALKTSPKATT
jgi:hypothetical protein